jgi:hypothetical protein
LTGRMVVPIYHFPFLNYYRIREDNYGSLTSFGS